ncbi:multiple epidermal growth factor-like domains protein 11 [Melanaphis sacchari]|uniref:Multiple epidermal growth factor-like domains protein 10 n=1 Tax=Melanaphis sacchari TaxID=742174 RepID=A0A2H8TZQ6_9HEMI|nr:multiple epidermal growth factor-like domains protein 11 [Melanaphis sacchari]XP_025199898.1 multiple epidermal growth factor-like domains protein 11 [Melanaphis sacchari]
MRGTTSYSNAAVLFAFLWVTIPSKPCLCYNTDCDFTESYDEVVTVSINEPVQVTKYKWCLDIPPRCPDNKREFRTVLRNVTVPKMRKVKRCCKDQIQLYDNCVSRCAEDQCPNIHCTPGTDKCKCKSGYTGHLCGQKCDVGRWGLDCANSCDKGCPDCDHRAGCCKTAAGGSSIFCGGGGGSGGTGDRLPGRKTVSAAADGRNGTVRKTDEPAPAVDRSGRFRMLSTTIRLQTATWEPAAVDEATNDTRTGRGAVDAAAAEARKPAETAAEAKAAAAKNRSAEPAWTPLEATALKYDELVTRLIWIFAMTLVAIALVFVIMFVVFFNCFGTTTCKRQDANTAAAARDTWPQPNADKVRETCISKQNLCNVPPVRYTKTPTLYTSTNVDLPIHPEIFCPVFSAPHYTGGSSLYDSPQPLYEILY